MTEEQIIKALKELLEIMLHEGDLQRSSTISNTLDLLKHKDAEVERLQKENERFADIGKMYSEIRAEAIKEFWDKAKQTREFRTCPYVYITDGDNLVKEMTEPVKLEHNSLCETETYMGE